MKIWIKFVGIRVTKILVSSIFHIIKSYDIENVMVKLLIYTIVPKKYNKKIILLLLIFLLCSCSSLCNKQYLPEIQPQTCRNGE